MTSCMTGKKGKRKHWLTRTAELLALDLADTLVSKAAWASTSCAACLDRVGTEIVS